MMNSECPDTRPFSTSPAHRRDRLCDQFEDAWNGPERPKIEDYLGATVGPDRSALLGELLALELEFRRRSREQPSPSEYERRFPEHVALIHETFGASALSPERIGRYQVRRRLGGGGFGHVYLCYDDRAERTVAIKVPRRDQLDSVDAMQAFLREARNVARLDHKGIVPLYDFGEADGNCYLVYKFIDGLSLGDRLRQGPVPHFQGARIIAEVAATLDYAHGENVFHRDIKPANILLDRQEQPFLTDFGLAVREEDLAGEFGRCSGTFPYMSPEQVRGEGHRIDGRTDIYGLSVVLYELLCNRRPFEGSQSEVFDQILHREARPPRQISHSIHPELERICLKAMAKQMNARYLTAGDMAEDLQLALAPPTPRPVPGAAETRFLPETGFLPSPSPRPQPLVRVVPKGLRSFDSEDSDFFLELLPGPRDRHGLPDSVRFWKTRIESEDADSAFAVGLVYGPSGCGKSSLVQAGLLPRLASSVRRAYVEATREHTEIRLAKALQRSCPDLSTAAPLPERLAHFRRGRALPNNVKLLVVLDQFEQWLHAHGHDMESTELVAALRQADGEHLQVILMVRDDFWMSVSRLFDCLEINLDRGRNTRAVDLFDADHARHVLRLFGQAFDRLPAEPVDLTREQEDFLSRAVTELSQDGRVIPVRLSLFADLMKERPWTRAALMEGGGAEGIGVRFLEETFTGRTALPDLRAMEKPARGLLQSLLPEHGTVIKGQMRSRQELAAASSLAEESSRFARLVELLDHELHIITPTEAEQEPDEQNLASPPEQPPLLTRASYYQLTHDYLVSALRKWLTQERRKTWRGRAEICLEERTAQWSRSRERRFLPSTREYLAIALGVPRRKRNAEQRALMRAGAWYYASRWGSALLAVFVLAFIINQYAASERLQRTETQIQSLFAAAPEGVPFVIMKLTPDRDLAQPLLQAHFRASNFRHQLRAACALAQLGEVEQEFLVNAIGTASAAECKNIVTALRPVKQAAVRELMARAHDTQASASTRIRYATVLLHLGETRAAKDMLALTPDPKERTTFIHSFKTWHGDLQALTNLLQPSEEGPFLSGLCAALGLLEPDALSDSEKEELQQVLSDLYCQAPDPGTHSASGWALRKWEALLPDSKPPATAPKSRRWFRNGLGMAMLEIKAGSFRMADPDDKKAKPRQVELKSSFFMGDRPVTADQFRQFVDDPECPATEKPRDWPGPEPDPRPVGDYPEQGVNWSDALLFCNWLSQKENLQPCYERTGVKRKVKVVDPMGTPEECEEWRWWYGKDGYRLPTDAEWEYACRAGTETKYAFGKDAPLLRHYGIFLEDHTVPAGSLLPNAWGLFDMHGNVMQWCWAAKGAQANPAGPDPLGFATSTGWSLRGGYYSAPAWQCTSASGMSTENPAQRWALWGFRVVCARKGTIN